MKAFVEITSGVIRVGPMMEAYGDPFIAAVAFSADEGVATLKALCLPETPLQKQAILKAVIAALSDLGLKARWIRHRGREVLA